MLVLDLWSINVYRVRTDFWIQTFFTSFSKTIYLFFQTQVYQIGDQYRPLKKQSKAFFMIHCKHTRPRLNKIWLKQKKIIYKAITALKKKNKTFYHFSRLYLSGQISRLFQNFPRIQNFVWTLPVLSDKKETKNCMFFFSYSFQVWHHELFLLWSLMPQQQ